MTKTKRPQASQLDAFQSHFSSAGRFGEERWQQYLYSALMEPTRYTALYNRYVPIADFYRAVRAPESLDRLTFPSASNDPQSSNLVCFVRKGDESSTPFPQPAKASNGLQTHWNLDAASVLAIHILSPAPGDSVLDLCASPGGKSLALAQSIWPHLQPDYPGPPLPPAKKGALHSNEFDKPRQRRLAENLGLYLPQSLATSSQQKVLNLDGTKGAQLFPLGAGGYDKVLVDAPCSSERHILHAQGSRASNQPVPPELVRWTPTAAKRMAEIQAQLLFTALKAVRVGGRVLYATCSISREENEGVIEKMLTVLGKERAKDSIRWGMEIVRLGGEVAKGLDVFGAERTEGGGWIVLPDRGGGWGPLFFTLIEKVQSAS